LLFLFGLQPKFSGEKQNSAGENEAKQHAKMLVNSNLFCFLFALITSQTLLIECVDPSISLSCSNDFDCFYYCDRVIHQCTNSFIELKEKCPDSSNRINPKQCGFDRYCSSSNECSEKKYNNEICLINVECRSGWCNFPSGKCENNPLLTMVHIGNTEWLLITIIIILAVLILTMFAQQSIIINSLQGIKEELKKVSPPGLIEKKIN
jgi:hypothetical protein